MALEGTTRVLGSNHFPKVSNAPSVKSALRNPESVERGPISPPPAINHMTAENVLPNSNNLAETKDVDTQNGTHKEKKSVTWDDSVSNPKPRKIRIQPEIIERLKQVPFSKWDWQGYLPDERKLMQKPHGHFEEIAMTLKAGPRDYWEKYSKEILAISDKSYSRDVAIDEFNRIRKPILLQILAELKERFSEVPTKWHQRVISLTFKRIKQYIDKRFSYSIRKWDQGDIADHFW